MSYATAIRLLGVTMLKGVDMSPQQFLLRDKICDKICDVGYIPACYFEEHVLMCRTNEKLAKLSASLTDAWKANIVPRRWLHSCWSRILAEAQCSRLLARLTGTSWRRFHNPSPEVVRRLVRPRCVDGWFGLRCGYCWYLESETRLVSGSVPWFFDHQTHLLIFPLSLSLVPPRVAPPYAPITHVIFLNSIRDWNALPLQSLQHIDYFDFSTS
ncbi:hypothetical protein HPB51_027570 [Rhipicephalus microplus]|uniref:Uncharacterized protein n=1 Tax=Rhipicephalus microplus TaxID=6941 RepID=A0A9J6CZK3_RHIMP|nr:hypothetical protein HPB51_027570 [Rhipicephalus microplus]